MTPDILQGFGYLALAALVYMAPTILAGTQHRNARAIFALNLLLGWTFVGWVAALIWALYRDREHTA